MIGKHINKILHGLINLRTLQPSIGSQTLNINHTFTTSNRRLNSKKPQDKHNMRSFRRRDSKNQVTPSPRKILLQLNKKENTNMKNIRGIKRCAKKEISRKRMGTLKRIIIKGSIRVNLKEMMISSQIRRPATLSTKD